MKRQFNRFSTAAVLLLGVTLARADVATGLVAYFDFENLTGAVGETVTDRSGHGHDGVCSQDQGTLKAPMLVAGPDGLGDALQFDGNFYVRIPNHADFNLSNELTLALWVSVDSLDLDWQTMLCRGDWSWRLHRQSTSDNACLHMSGLAGGYGADGTTTNIRVPKRWLHLVGTYKNGAGARLYINGALEAAAPDVSGLINTVGDDPVTIGAQIDNGSLRRQWRGAMDDVRIYNRALSVADVAELYAYVTPGVNSRPVIAVPADRVLSGPTNLQLTATVSDDGNPLPANPATPSPSDPHRLRWTWSALSWPSVSQGVVWSGGPTNGEVFTYAGSANPPGTVFTCAPTASFDAPGLYVLNFSASDGEKTASRAVTISVQSAGDYRNLGYRYLSPAPGAEYCSPQTRFVLVRFQSVSPSALTNLADFIQVQGTVSGIHRGQTKIATDGRTVIFEMTSDFSRNELVTVTLTPRLAPGAGTVDPYQYQFVISGHMPDALAASARLSTAAAATGTVASASPAEGTTTAGSNSLASSPQLQSGRLKDGGAVTCGQPLIMPNGVSIPSDFPCISITTCDNPDPEYIFLDNRGGGGKPYNVIFDNTGSPVWYQRMPEERRDMKVQHNGLLTMLARTGGYRFVGLDPHYREVASYWAVNGYSTDEHELQVLADGRCLLIGLRSETVDMSRYLSGGNPAASVGETVIQEFTAAGELIFQWRAWDHYDVRDVELDDPRSSSFRFPHMNAIDIDTDGNILLSCRHLSEVTKINRDTGEIIWRLGGNHSDFTFPNDPLKGFRNQHAVRVVGTNHYTLFDNGNLHSPSVSRAVEYALGLQAHTAAVVWQYPATPTTSLYSYYMGNAQRLPNGNTLINWAVGSLPKLTEVRPDGTKAFEMNWVARYEAYRVWRCPWQGAALKPYLILEPSSDYLTLIFNQFGDTNVAYYCIYGGTSPQPTTLLTTSPTTLKRLTNLENGRLYYFRVTAVGRNGVEGDYSNEESVTVKLVKPGRNLVANGDFSQGTAGWTWSVSGGASAAWKLTNGVTRFDITNGGTAISSVQLRQAGLPLVQGRKYVFEFDGWSDAPRYIEAKVGQDVSPYVNYSGIGYSYVTPGRTHFRYVFTMQQASDFNSRVVFNAGTSPLAVYLDNVSLFSVPPGDFNLDGRVDYLDLAVLTGEWRKQQTGLVSDLDGNGKVNFADFGILGENWSGGP